MWRTSSSAAEGCSWQSSIGLDVCRSNLCRERVPHLDSARLPGAPNDARAKEVSRPLPSVQCEVVVEVEDVQRHVELRAAHGVALIGIALVEEHPQPLLHRCVEARHSMAALRAQLPTRSLHISF